MTEDTTGPADDPKPDARAKAKSAPRDKVEKLADDAVNAGAPILESETGRKVVDAADSVFDAAGDLADKAMATDIGRKVAGTMDQVAAKAIDSEMGRKALDSEAGQTARKIWGTSIGRNVGTGAAAGAALGLVIPIVGPISGAVVGGGLGYLRTLSKKP